MKITILTLFPQMVEVLSKESILGRGQKAGVVEINTINIRDFGIGKHKTVDDTPYGGGAGMVLKPDVIVPAIKEAKKQNKKAKVILMTPQGKIFSQKSAKELAKEKGLILVCGHYEGFDERIRDYVDDEISIGDYVLTGGELAAMVVTDAVARLIPGVLGKEESHQEESFSIRNSLAGQAKLETRNLLEYPQYTRPEEFEGKVVPAILLSGNHAEIEKWRKKQSIERTKLKRPDLLED